MIVERITGQLQNTKKAVDEITLEWYERDKKRMRKVSKDGEEIGIAVETGLKENDILYEDDNRVIVVKYAPSELIQISVASMQEMGRLCFELGNRHMTLEIRENTVTIPYDAFIYDYLQNQGFKLQTILGKYTDYIGCKAHEHTHGHSQL